MRTTPAQYCFGQIDSDLGRGAHVNVIGIVAQNERISLTITGVKPKP